MALVLEIILGVMILASFVVAFMSAKHWPVYQVVLVVFVFLGTVGFFYLSARTLKTHQAWQSAVKRLETEIASTQAEIGLLRNGGPVDDKGQPNPQGIRQLLPELHALAGDRGGILTEVELVGVKDGVVQLKLKSAGHGLAPKMVLFAFDQAALADGGRYRGEFKVVSVAESGVNVEVAPNLPLSPAQMQALSGAKGPWVMYTMMPIDDADLFAAMDEPTRAALLPAEKQAEFAKADRKLRDYEFFFHENFVQRSLLSDSISELNSNIARMTAATTEVGNEAGYRESEKKNLQSDLENMVREREAIVAYETTLRQMFDKVRDDLKQTYVTARKLAADLTTRQLKAAEEINQRTAAAQTAVASPLGGQ